MKGIILKNYSDNEEHNTHTNTANDKMPETIVSPTLLWPWKKLNVNHTYFQHSGVQKFKLNIEKRRCFEHSKCNKITFLILDLNPAWRQKKKKWNLHLRFKNLSWTAWPKLQIFQMASSFVKQLLFCEICIPTFHVWYNPIQQKVCLHS